MRSSPTSSSSATICARAVRMPCPISTLPGNTVTVPSRLMRSQRSSRRLAFKLPGSLRGAAAGVSLISFLVTRHLSLVTGLPAGHVLSSAFNGTQDPKMRAAAAQVALQGCANFRVRRARIGVEQGLGGHDDAGRAVAALRCLLGNERLLQG